MSATYDMFPSHNSADKPAVEELARRLVKAGIEPWLDTWNLIPGEPWLVQTAQRGCGIQREWSHLPSFKASAMEECFPLVPCPAIEKQTAPPAAA